LVAPTTAAQGAVDAMIAQPAKPPADPDAVAAPPDVAPTSAPEVVAAADAQPAALADPPLVEKAIALLVPFGEDYRAVACWVVPAAGEPWAPSGMPRWESDASCVALIAVGDKVFAEGGKSGSVTGIEGDKLRTDLGGPFLVIAPAGDRRLASIFPARSGPLASLLTASSAPAAAEPAPSDPTADVQGGSAPDVAAAPADTAAPLDDVAPAPADVAVTADGAADAAAAVPVAPIAVMVAGRAAASADQIAAVTRMIKRINGSDYPQADISVGDAIVADLNGDDKVDVLVLGSSFDDMGEGHSSGGGAFMADGRTPNRFLELAIEGQMTSIDLIALSDLDGNGRREFLIEMQCPTGTGYYLGQLGGEGGDGANISGLTTLGSVEEQGFMGAGLASSIKQALPYRSFANAKIEAVGLAAFADLLGVALDAPVATLASRFGPPFSETADAWNTVGTGLSFSLVPTADGSGKIVRGVDIDRDAALSAVERSQDAVGLPLLLDMTPKEFANALRPTLGKVRLANGPGVSYDGTLPDGRGLLLTFACASETAACNSVRAATYVPRKGLTARLSVLGLTRRSVQADLEKLFGAHEVAAGAAPGSASFAGGKVSATYTDGTLKSLTVSRDGVAAIKKPGFFADVGQPEAVFIARWGQPDDTGGAANANRTWYVPGRGAALFTVALGCSDTACDVMTVTFE